MDSNRVLLDFQIPIQDAVSTLQFAPLSNNLLVSSWDSILRLYDVDNCTLRLELTSEAALLDCCFQNESLALSAASDGCIRRYELQSGIFETVGKHDDSVTHIRYSDQTCQIVTAGLDGKIQLWDTRNEKSLSFVRNMGSDVISMSLSGFNLIVASGACVYLLDLRNLEKSIQLKDSYMKVPVACVSSVPYSEGVAVGSVDGRVALDIACLDQTDDISNILASGSIAFIYDGPATQKIPTENPNNSVEKQRQYSINVEIEGADLTALFDEAVIPPIKKSPRNCLRICCL
ncbi:mitotic checkpoint protein BUB3.3 [Cucumis melo var. makuwa]|uniref:Mitotic checkpoint protein BUB3.3 n=1 Tax=Cucumis melo var. makuwa TaxID=1194695 RepID=A0A5D3DCW9_CUCMM|nr:mitotic checkpoint protein BUB3.3 [Cucumis melo var. makuwa]TYK21507.1 mitotic checkpoint protein BUB3.3 [Cucumis melo var. makuwa]